jgi:predicted nucleic acid-binding protein
MFVLDCSVTMAWLFEDEKNEYTENVLDRLNDESVIVPPIWKLEVLNVLLVALRRKRIRQAEAIRFLEMLKQFPIKTEETDFQDFESLLLLANSHGLSSYDAAYLDIALRMGLPLASLDKNLLQAAKKTGVKLLV